MRQHYFILRAWLVVAALSAVCFACTNEPSEELRPKLAHLERELSAISPMVGSTEVARDVSIKRGRGLAEIEYSGRIGWRELLQHYDPQFRAHGWVVRDTLPVRDWGRDYGGMIRRYCKDDLMASLQYAGRDTDSGWQFAVAVTWDPSDDSCNGR
jgi:hypothetical protein